MSKIEEYELIDKVIEKEKNTKKLKLDVKENDFKGGEGFICSLNCKTCGETTD